MSSYDQVILDHYRKVAESDGLSGTSTMADVRTRELETALIVDFARKARSSLPNASRRTATLFDIGCGNGYTLSVMAKAEPAMEFRGFEYTPELRELAKRQVSSLAAVAGVHPADIREPSWSGGRTGDIAVVQRVLINLLNVEDQRQALRNVVSALRPGGCVLFIESFAAGLENLNRARAEFDLDPIPPAHHNLPLEEDFFRSDERLEPFEVDGWHVPANFLSSHFFVARVLHPILLGARPFRRNSLFVSFMSQALTPAIGEFSPIKAFAFRRKAG